MFDLVLARKVLALGVQPFTLGADMHGYNVKVPNEGIDADSPLVPLPLRAEAAA